MQVSTVSVYSVDSLKTYEKSVINDDRISNSSFEKQEKNNSVNLQQTYTSINEWKDFCHEQILENNINFIA